MLVGIHLMLPENGMEAKGHFGKKHSPVDAGVQKCAIQCVLWHGAKSMKMIGSGTCNRLSPQAHDEERDEEGGQGIALSLLEFEIPNDFTDSQCLHDD